MTSTGQLIRRATIFLSITYIALSLNYFIGRQESFNLHPATSLYDAFPQFFDGDSSSGRIIGHTAKAKSKQSFANSASSSTYLNPRTPHTHHLPHHHYIHKPAPHILQNPKLPNWVKDYADWHAQQRQLYIEARKNSTNATNTAVNAANDVRFLISRCLQNDSCGGASDRLQDMPYNLMLANQSRRVLLIKWEKPVALEEFLVPPLGGIDWRIPNNFFDEGENWHLRGKEGGVDRIVSTIRRDSAAPIFKNYENTELGGDKIYHEIFRLLFTPSPTLATRVSTTMSLLSLSPYHYSSVHLRVKYPVKGIDEKTFTFEKHKGDIQKWAINAVNCAAQLHGRQGTPHNATIYVSSDNNDTVGYLLEDSPFAEHARHVDRHNEQLFIDGKETPHHAQSKTKKNKIVHLVARDYSQENEHVAFSSNKEAESFMSVFEDLMIMGLGKCVAHGVGGYGRLAAALSGGECVVAHRGRHAETCTDVLARIEEG